MGGPFSWILTTEAFVARFSLEIFPYTQIGESRAPNIPRTGEIVQVDFGDGVFTGRETHTS